MSHPVPRILHTCWFWSHGSAVKKIYSSSLMKKRKRFDNDERWPKRTTGGGLDRIGAGSTYLVRGGIQLAEMPDLRAEESRDQTDEANRRRREEDKHILIQLNGRTPFVADGVIPYALSSFCCCMFLLLYVFVVAFRVCHSFLFFCFFRCFNILHIYFLCFFSVWF